MTHSHDMPLRQDSSRDPQAETLRRDSIARILQMMTGGRAATYLASVVMVALVLSCVGDLAQAAMPNAEPMPCSTLLCDGQTGCGTKPSSTAVVPIAALVAVVVVSPPVSLPITPVATTSSVFPSRQFAPLAPRSPPIV
jgi:hypothetical protein